MIYTVTFNPSLDYIVSMDSFEMGRTNRTIGEQMFPGGKGINVSIVLNNLGIKNTALGFTAGFTGDQIECEVRKMGLLTDFIHLDKGLSRINVKLKDYDGTEINGMGPDIGQIDVNDLYAKLDRLVADDILVLAGSIPNSLPDSIYSDILARLQKKGVLFVVDATKDLLLNVLQYQPFLIKPNNHELGEIFQVTLNTREEVCSLCEEASGKRCAQCAGVYGGTRSSSCRCTGRSTYACSTGGKACQCSGRRGFYGCRISGGLDGEKRLCVCISDGNFCWQCKRFLRAAGDKAGNRACVSKT